MADGGFRGTNIEQDSRFADKQKKLLKSIKFPASYSQKVNMSKVKIEVMKPWIHKRVIEILGVEDELLINFIFEMLEAKKLDPKELQINLTEFLAKETPGFVTQLWGLLLSAQENVAGIPQVFLDEKMREVKKMEEDAARMREELARRQAGSGAVGRDIGSEIRAGGREEAQEMAGKRSSRWNDSGREEKRDGVDRQASSQRGVDRHDSRRDESGRDDRRDGGDRYRDSREYSRRESGRRDDYEREERGSRRERDDSRRDSRGDYSRRESDHKHRDYERESRREVDQRSDRRSNESHHKEEGHERRHRDEYSHHRRRHEDEPLTDDFGRERREVRESSGRSGRDDHREAKNRQRHHESNHSHGDEDHVDDTADRKRSSRHSESHHANKAIEGDKEHRSGSEVEDDERKQHKSSKKHKKNKHKKSSRHRDREEGHEKHELGGETHRENDNDAGLDNKESRAAGARD